MPAYDYLCERGWVNAVIARGWNEAESMPCAYHENCRLVGMAPSSTPAIHADFDNYLVVPFLDKKTDFKGTGKNVYSSRQEYEQELKVQGKIINEPGIDKDAERNAKYKEEAHRKKIHTKLAELVQSGKLDKPAKEAGV